MTVATMPRYDSDRLSETGGRAVVVGGSMAGLLAARVLADAFESVTVIDRDPLPDEPVARRGVPQGRHVHVLLEAGRATLEDLFPGFGEELIVAGGLVIDLARDFRFYDEGDFLAEGPYRLPMYCASRPLIEWIVRRRVADLDGVDVRGECRFADYLVDGAASTVDGVAIRDGNADAVEIAADLVVDATGRTSRTPTWLEDHGYPSPRVDEVTVDLAYSTLHLDRPPHDRRGFLVLPPSHGTRGGGVFPAENGRWLMTMAGVHGDHPPTDVEGFADFAASLPVPELRRLLDDHEILSEDIDRYPYTSILRRHYWDLDRFPDGLVVTGDAIASFNPVYGQGMSVAALEAVQLHHTLAAGGRDDLARRFFGRIEGVVDDAWRLAVSADFRFPQTTGPKPPGTDLLNRYLARLTRKAHTDGVLADAFARVITMERRPISLFRPRVLWRVLKPAL